jgi:hypothetical protein
MILLPRMRQRTSTADGDMFLGVLRPVELG